MGGVVLHKGNHRTGIVVRALVGDGALAVVGVVLVFGFGPHLVDELFSDRLTFPDQQGRTAEHIPPFRRYRAIVTTLGCDVPGIHTGIQNLDVLVSVGNNDRFAFPLRNTRMAVDGEVGNDRVRLAVGANPDRTDFIRSVDAGYRTFRETFVREYFVRGPLAVAALAAVQGGRTGQVADFLGCQVAGRTFGVAVVEFEVQVGTRHIHFEDIDHLGLVRHFRVAAGEVLPRQTGHDGVGDKGTDDNRGRIRRVGVLRQEAVVAVLVRDFIAGSCQAKEQGCRYEQYSFHLVCHFMCVH